MMNAQDTFRKQVGFIRDSATLKVLSIGVLVMVLLIPSSMISSLMRERASRRDAVVQEINQKWGNSQTIIGPFFTVPFKSVYRDDNNRPKLDVHYLHVLPQNLRISGRIDAQIRYRSIYEAVLYNVQINIDGNFTMPSLHQSNIDSEFLLWEKAMFTVGITDMRGIKDKIVVKFNEENYKASPGIQTTDVAASGVQCNIPLTPRKGDNTFSFQLNLNGSEQIHFTPLGETTSVNLRSSWPSPSFNGAFLPAQREIGNVGFSAAWKILDLNRKFPQFWEGDRYKVGESSFGLKLLITPDKYQKSIRISKYALVFVVFTFSAFFFSEIIDKKRVHPIQYVLIGFAIILFYILLLSISEHLNFDFAYIFSAVAVTTIITCYSKSILKSNRFTLTVLGTLVILYAYLYLVLRLEDYALILGSVGLFIVLTTAMYITRKIDWYSLDND